MSCLLIPQTVEQRCQVASPKIGNLLPSEFRGQYQRDDRPKYSQLHRVITHAYGDELLLCVPGIRGIRCHYKRTVAPLFVRESKGATVCPSSNPYPNPYPHPNSKP